MTGREFTHLDGDGGELTITPWDRSALLGMAGGKVTVAVGTADVPGIAAALYEATGLPAPVILERPALTGEQSLAHALDDGLAVVGAEAGRVRMSLSGDIRFSPDGARMLAAIIAARADEAEDEPDPADVDELTGVIRKLAGGTQIDGLARAILRAGYRREARDA